MSARLLALLLVSSAAPVAVVACGGGGGGNKPPPLGSTDSGTDSASGGDGSAPTDGGKADGASRDGASDSGSAGDGMSGADGSSNDASVDSGADGGSTGDSSTWMPESGPPQDGSPPPNPVCDPSTSYAAIARESSIASSGFDRFGGISADGTTVAWTTAAGQIYVADRSSPSGTFGTPALLDPGSTQLANDRVAVDRFGLQLIATLANKSTFVAFSRPSIGGSWTVVLGNEFSILAVQEGQGFVSNPVLSVDGNSLFYVVQTGSSAPKLAESFWDPSLKIWSAGVDLPNPEFAMTGTAQLRRPTGASFDRQTLFFYDEIAGHERIAWRNSAAQPFDFFQDEPTIPEGAPTQTCSYVFFHGSDSNGQGLFYAQ